MRPLLISVAALFWGVTSALLTATGTWYPEFLNCGYDCTSGQSLRLRFAHEPASDVSMPDLASPFLRYFRRRCISECE